MKRRTITALVISMILAMTMSFASCSKEPTNLEEYVNQNQESMQKIQETADQNHLAIDIAENDVTYTYDLANQEGITEEIATSDKMKEALSTSLGQVSETFAALAKQLEEESGMTGVQIIVKYTYGETPLAEKTFNSSGAVE